jgi:acetyl esterase
VLLCPAVDPGCDTPSHHATAGGSALNRDDIRWLWEQYVRDPNGSVEITAAPLLAETEQLSGLPPALVVTAEVDVLRDEGERYASRLRQAGVEVLATRYLGTVHGFCHLEALRETSAARADRTRELVPGPPSPRTGRALASHEHDRECPVLEAVAMCWSRSWLGSVWSGE